MQYRLVNKSVFHGFYGCVWFGNDLVCPDQSRSTGNVKCFWTTLGSISYQPILMVWWLYLMVGHPRNPYEGKQKKSTSCVQSWILIGLGDLIVWTCMNHRTNQHPTFEVIKCPFLVVGSLTNLHHPLALWEDGGTPKMYTSESGYQKRCNNPTKDNEFIWNSSMLLVFITLSRWFW